MAQWAHFFQNGAKLIAISGLLNMIFQISAGLSVNFNLIMIQKSQNMSICFAFFVQNDPLCNVIGAWQG